MLQRNDSGPAVSVVVPVRNEAGNIAPLVAEIAAALAGRVFEILYVNDGSRDATEQELRGLMTLRPWLRQLRHAQSCGQSAAVRSGVVAARAAIVVTLDGDGQNDPAFIPALLAALEQGAPQIGLVAGQRVGRKATGFKRWQSRTANAVRGAVLNVGYVDVVDRPRRHGTSNYGLWDRLWVGILDLAGVWWLIRRRRRVPECEEVTLAR
jgi:dolichol-phosphate mannosyltransferase